MHHRVTGRLGEERREKRGREREKGREGERGERKKEGRERMSYT